MKSVTDLAQMWNDDGDDSDHIVDKVTREILEATIENYDLETTNVQEAQLEMLLREIVEESIDWERLDETNRNARDWEDARRSALYR